MADNPTATEMIEVPERIFLPGSLEINFTFYRSIAGAIEFKSLRTATKKIFTGYDQKITELLEYTRPMYVSPYIPMARSIYNTTIDAKCNIDVRDALGHPHHDIALEIYLKHDKVECRDWRRSDLSGFLSDDFMSSLIAGHFHIEFKEESRIKVGNDGVVR